MVDEKPWELGSRAARRRRAGQLHGEVLAKARWGAAGWDSRAHTHLQKNDHGSKAGSAQHETRHRGDSPRHGAAASGSPVHRLGRLPHKHQQRRVGTARSWRWGAPAPPPRFSPVARTKTAQDVEPKARRALGTGLDGAARERPRFPGKAARAPALTGSPGAHGLG
jgi:hypothetical protein